MPRRLSVCVPKSISSSHIASQLFLAQARLEQDFQSTVIAAAATYADREIKQAACVLATLPGMKQINLEHADMKCDDDQGVGILETLKRETRNEVLRKPVRVSGGCFGSSAAGESCHRSTAGSWKRPCNVAGWLLGPICGPERA